MAWVYLDDQFPDHPKMVLAGGDAGWLWACGLAYVRRYSTGGLVPKAQVPKLSDRKSPLRLARRLVEVGLWEDRGEHYAFHDYGDWNKSQESRSTAGRKAARARWDRHGDANADANASETHSESDSDPPTNPDASECTIPIPVPENDSPQPPAERGAPDHHGQHVNCRDCGTNRRSATRAAKPPPAPDPFAEQREAARRQAEAGIATARSIVSEQPDIDLNVARAAELRDRLLHPQAEESA